MTRRLFGCCILIIVAFAGQKPGAASAEDRRHPNLHAALYELGQARIELRDSPHDFRGHRAKAIAALDDAIGTLRLILVIKGDFRLSDRGPDFYRRYKDYPRLRQAMVDLAEARAELRDSREFAPLKERGLRDIGRASEQIELVLKNTR